MLQISRVQSLFFTTYSSGYEPPISHSCSAIDSCIYFLINTEYKVQYMDSVKSALVIRRIGYDDKPLRNSCHLILAIYN